jgi:hypothetical protein
MHRVVIIANKTWEVDPLIGVLLHEKVRTTAFTKFKFTHHPVLAQLQSLKPPQPDPTPQPRIEFQYEHLAVEVWCLQDVMNPAVSSSSSLEKANKCPRIFSWKQTPPEVTIAFGTAAFPPGPCCNGNVVVGTRVFVHDPYPDALPKTTWKPPRHDVVIDSSVPDGFFREVQESVRFAAENRFIVPPLRAATPPVILAGQGMVAMSVVNVTNYDDYVWTDREAVKAFTEHASTYELASVETTHGLIRSLCGKGMFFYVSGIANEQGTFDLETVPRVYAQNFVAAHNAGVTVSYLIPELAAKLPPGSPESRVMQEKPSKRKPRRA